jgi:hypothetical protein
MAGMSIWHMADIYVVYSRMVAVAVSMTWIEHNKIGSEIAW